MELVQLRANEIIEDRRAATIKVWSEELRCYQHACEPEDHLTENEIKDIKAKILTNEKLEKRLFQLCRGVKDLNELGRAYLDIGMHDSWWYTHSNRWGRWEQRVGEFIEEGPNVFQDYSQNALQYFGLEIAIASLSLDDDPVPTRYDWTNSDGGTCPATTVAWLRLPANESVEREWATRHGGAGSAVSPTQISASQTARFERAMRVLGLEVFVHPSQAHAGAQEQQSEEGGKGTRTRLTLLAQTTRNW